MSISELFTNFTYIQLFIICKKENMSYITVKVEFTDDIGGTFEGSISDLMTEVYRRSSICGKTSYKLIMEPTVVFLIEGEGE